MIKIVEPLKATLKKVTSKNGVVTGGVFLTGLVFRGRFIRFTKKEPGTIIFTGWYPEDKEIKAMVKQKILEELLKPGTKIKYK